MRHRTGHVPKQCYLSRQRYSIVALRVRRKVSRHDFIELVRHDVEVVIFIEQHFQYYILINLSHLNSSYHYGTYCQYTNLCITEEPCQNGGDCVTSAGDYSCQCAQGYDDRNCSTELYCITQNVTCENNVTCTNQDGEYV